MRLLILIFTVSGSLLSCREPEEEILNHWQQERDSIAKHRNDSIQARLDFIIELVNAGKTVEQARAIADKTDSLCR